MKAKYDTIGINYAQKRKSDPRIAAQILNKLDGAQRIVNIGAGAGSYEPSNMDLVAVEPSLEMINQRGANAHPVVQGSAESLPFPDHSFTHALTILSMHHWENRALAFKEINRVATERFVAVSWDPESEPFWLTRDYFPEIIEWDRTIFPDVNEIHDYFDDVEIEPLLIPEDCIDGFLAAYWKRPSAYLDESVRNSISSFSKLNDISKGLKQLESDIESKAWFDVNQSILNQSTLDAGYVIISGKTKSV
ncbi:methyltransferase domain-containing protein [Winogradskyella sp. 3972H.M.0a.05]|uniref:class I SAM-dependent methyltransferase n=1 Tax=Winogradskyella sp. 3972H.M.0a.05 TaxID=2950277 RepID=UPI003395CCAD